MTSTLASYWSSTEPLVHLFLVDFLLRGALVVWVLIRKSKTPQTALTWIVLIIALPFVGLVVYLLIGETRLGKWRRRRHAHALETIDRPEVRASADPKTHVELETPSKQIASVAEQVSDAPTVGGNRLKLLGDSKEFVDLLVEDINGARNHVHMLYFIYLDDHSGRRVADALLAAVERGVHCRLLVDGVGSKAFLKSKLHHRMKAGGVRIAACLPVNPVRMLFARIDLRNHRKIGVIDGQIGYTGSNNLADAAFAVKPKYAPWVDCTVRIDGPATKELQVLFLEDWYMETDEFLEEELCFRPTVHDDGLPVQVIATGPNFYTEATTQLIQACSQIARRELVLTTPYFVPDQATITNLQVAARRGVAVTLVVPRNNDSWLVGSASRSNYESLLKAGVRVMEFRKGLLHAKTITVDKDIAFVMSANLDRRSYELNFECGGIIYDTDFASELRFLQQHYMDNSDPISLETWLKRPLAARVRDSAAGLMSPLL
ncbi:MAG: cardiolipin synthase [Phycisphaerales bacterium]|nr:cardiolipin synthase [Phycisphaerales bacterium]